MSTLVDDNSTDKGNGLRVDLPDLDATYRTLFEQGTYFAGVMTIDGTVVEANRICVHGCGFTREQVIGKKFWECGWWSPSPALVEKIQRASIEAAKGITFRKDVEYFVADGSRRFIDLTIAPVRNNSGKILLLIPTGTDITERKLAEEALTERNHLVSLRADITASLINGGDVSQALQECTEALVKHLNVAFARIWMLNEREQVLELRASAGLYTHIDGPHGRVKVGEFKIGRIAKNAQALLTNDVRHDPNISSPEWAAREGMVAFAGYPMILDGRVIGVMAMFARHPLSEVAFVELDPIGANIAQWMERRQIEETLKETKARLEATLVASEVATWTWDIERDRVFADANLARMFSVSAADAQGGSIQKYLEAIHPEDQARVKSIIAKLLKSSQQQYEMDYRLQAPDGSVRSVVARGKVERNASGNPIRFPGVVIDITDRKKIEEDLSASEERFRTLADNMSQLAWMGDATGQLFWYNQRWFDYTGTTLEDMQGWGWEKVHHPDHLSRVVTKWSAHLRESKGWEDTFPLRGTDGKYRWFLSRAIPIRDDHNVVVRWFGTNTDVTELRDVQDALKDAQKALAEQNQMLDQTVQDRTAMLQKTIMELEAFSYSISHDMRSPLRAMQGYAEALLEDYRAQLEPQAVHYLERIHRGATRLDLLVRDVLAYSKVAKGDVSIAPINMELLIADIVQNYPNLHSSHITVKVSKLPMVMAHEGLLTQIVANLLGNALKFSAPGTFPEVHISAETMGPEVKIWFEDNGIGVAPQHQDQIFKIFGRVHPEKAYEGTGIGLAIVRKSAERMGGSVGVVSEIGKGSRFWVILKKAL